MTTYQASATKAEVEARREALLDIIEAGRPMTVRQVFYQATVRGLVEKAESGYGKIQTDLTIMRRAGELPYDWLADNTRWQRKPRTFDSVEQALRDTARLYRKSLWTDLPRAGCADPLSASPTGPRSSLPTNSMRWRSSATCMASRRRPRLRRRARMALARRA